jgi:N utilization substance protein B
MSSIERRYESRELLLKFIFQWEYTDNDSQFDSVSIIDGSVKYDKKYFQDISADIFKKIEFVDESIKQHSSKDIIDLSKVELAVLRLAVYELLFRDDVPFKVCIDQAARLNKKFGTVQGYKYVNGVLDAVARERRQLEYLAAKNKG